MLFCRANLDDVRQVVHCLNKYCKWTDQALNYTKSGAFFSKNVSKESKLKIKGILEMKELPKNTKYLSNPLFVGKNRSSAYEDLKIKMENGLQGWKNKLLSLAPC